MMLSPPSAYAEPLVGFSHAPLVASDAQSAQLLLPVMGVQEGGCRADVCGWVMVGDR